jgi:hypothetical protein
MPWDQGGEGRPRGCIEAKMEAAGVRWRECCLTSVQGQRRVYKEPVSLASFFQPSHLLLSPPQHEHPVTPIITGNVMSIETSISQRPQSWRGKRNPLSSSIGVTMFGHEPLVNRSMKVLNDRRQPGVNEYIVIPDSEDEWDDGDAKIVDDEDQHLRTETITFENSLPHKPSWKSTLDNQVLAKSYCCVYS